jgi:hypothetical protein
MKKFFTIATIILAFTILTVLPFSCNKAQAEVFKVRELSLELGQYTSLAPRDAYLDTPRTGALTHQVNLNWNIDLACGYNPTICWFWDNKIESKAGAGRFRMVGWVFENGLTFGKLDIFYYHHSQHMLEQIANDLYKDTSHKYPVEDAYMLRFNFIKDRRR